MSDLLEPADNPLFKFIWSHPAFGTKQGWPKLEFLLLLGIKVAGRVHRQRHLLKPGVLAQPVNNGKSIFLWKARIKHD
jgi:hypothetical protein